MALSPQVFEFVTIFPELIDGFVRSGLMGKAIESGRVQVHAVDPRSFATDKHRSVDDAPFGGGAGMVMMPEPVAAAVESVERDRGPSFRVLLTPSAPRFDQVAARELSRKDHLTFLCGRYEGIDDRIREQMADACYSLGDFVLNGGEVAALAIFEAVARLREGVLGNPESAETESFAASEQAQLTLLEHPHYTRPANWRGHEVPEVLRGGDHERIARWRLHVALERTHALRPELRPQLESLRSALALPHVLAVQLPKDFDLSSLEARSAGASLEPLWVGGRGRPAKGVSRARTMREVRQYLRRKLRTFESGSRSEGESEKKLWTVELVTDADAPPDALSARSLGDLLRIECSKSSAPDGIVFVLRWPGAPDSPQVDARMRIALDPLDSRSAREQKDRKALAIQPPLIDISQPASPQVGLIAAALERSLGL